MFKTIIAQQKTLTASFMSAKKVFFDDSFAGAFFFNFAKCKWILNQTTMHRRCKLSFLYSLSQVKLRYSIKYRKSHHFTVALSVRRFLKNIKIATITFTLEASIEIYTVNNQHHLKAQNIFKNVLIRLAKSPQYSTVLNSTFRFYVSFSILYRSEFIP